MKLSLLYLVCDFRECGVLMKFNAACIICVGSAVVGGKGRWFIFIRTIYESSLYILMVGCT